MAEKGNSIKQFFVLRTTLCQSLGLHLIFFSPTSVILWPLPLFLLPLPHILPTWGIFRISTKRFCTCSLFPVNWSMIFTSARDRPWDQRRTAMELTPALAKRLSTMEEKKSVKPVHVCHGVSDGAPHQGLLWQRWRHHTFATGTYFQIWNPAFFNSLISNNTFTGDIPMRWVIRDSLQVGPTWIASRPTIM